MSDKIDTVRLQTLSRAFIGSAALFAAIDLELFTAIAEGEDTPASFAQRAGISELNADRLMVMCAANGLIEWHDDRYRNAPDVDRYLVKGARYAGAWLQFLRPGWERWGRLTDLLSTTEPAQVTPRSVVDITVESAREYHTATASVGFGAGRRFARDVDLSARHTLMDIGGGSGAYSIVAVQENPQLRAVVFDLPPVVEVTAEFIAEHDVQDRVATAAGDFTRDPLPEGCDVAVMASNLPMYGRDIIQSVIDKAFNALEPGGEMHLVGEMLDDDRRGPPDAALWGLAEALGNSTGLAHTRAECRGYFEKAGYEEIVTHEFIPGVLVRVSGRKPG